jgi:hypothetical protein
MNLIHSLSTYKFGVISGDLMLHMAIGFIMSCIAIKVLSLKNTLLLVLLVAILKECYDLGVLTANMYESSTDIVATMLGGYFIYILRQARQNERIG